MSQPQEQELMDECDELMAMLETCIRSLEHARDYLDFKTDSIDKAKALLAKLGS